MPTSFEMQLHALATDHMSPSSSLAVRASALLQEVATTDPEALPEIARQVVRAQPAMAALACVANTALRALEALGIGSVGPALVALQRGIDVDRVGAARELVRLQDEPVRVVTTSASASVIEAIQALHKSELLLDVVCSESRPLLEGTSLARWLAGQGYDALLVLDAALPDHLIEKSIFVVGTDAILPESIANKRGTRLFATWAELAGVPRYVLATRDKLYPPALVPCFENPERPVSEVLRDAPETLRVENRAFDLTPRIVWTEILVGNRTLQESESTGDHALARGLEPLLARNA